MPDLLVRHRCFWEGKSKGKGKCALVPGGHHFVGFWTASP